MAASSNGAKADLVLLSGRANIRRNQINREIFKSGWGITLGEDGDISTPEKFENTDLTKKISAFAKSFKRKQQNENTDQSQLPQSAGSQPAGGQQGTPPQTGKFDGLVLTSLTGRAEEAPVLTLPEPSNNDGEATPPPIPSANAQGNGAPSLETPQDGFLGIKASANSVDENIDTTNAVKIGTVTPLGTNTSNLTYKIIGAGNSLFSVDQSGNLFVKKGASIDFESTSSHKLLIRTTNNQGKAKTKPLTITINDVNDAPSAVSLSNTVLPDQLIYDTVETKTGNVITNKQFQNNGEGWSTYTDTQSYGDSFDGDVWRAGRDWSQLSQTYRPSDDGFTIYDSLGGLTLKYGGQHYTDENQCGSGTNCRDLIEYGVHIYEGDEKDTKKYSNRQHTRWRWYKDEKKIDYMPDRITYFMNGKDYGPAVYQVGRSTRFKKPYLTITYDEAQDLVVGQLSASDDDSGDTHSYSLSNDASGLFELRGDLLILDGGSVLDAGTQASYDLDITVTDQDGAASTLPVTVTVNDVGEVSTHTRQALAANEDSAFSKTFDFGQSGATITNTDLPAWMTLSDLSNGKVRISGTPTHSGEKGFSITSTKDGKTTTAHYTLTAAESCTGAYCAQFVSSADTDSITTYALTDSKHMLGSTEYSEYASWNDLYGDLNTGTGVYSREGLSLNVDNGGGTWTGNMRYTVNYANRTIESLAWGTFSGHTYGDASNAAGAFTARGSAAFSASNSDCSGAGICTIADSVSSYTCTGSGQCTEDNHASVDINVNASFKLLQNASNDQAAVGGIDIAAADNTALASSGDVTLLAE